MTRVSVIMPVLDDAAELTRTLPPVLAENPHEVVVVDGGSADGSPEVARAQGAVVVVSPPGRGRQLNAGAAAATGDVLFFLHADTVPPTGYPEEIVRLLGAPRVAAGAFRFRLDGDAPRLRWVERAVHLRSRFLQLPYGDQGLFVKRSAWEAAGRYPQWDALEDLELVRRLKRRGRIATSPLSATTSPRRWQQRGLVRTTLVNQLCLLAFLCHVSPERVARWRAR